MEELTSLNPEALIAFIGLYNPYGEEVEELKDLLYEWNEQAQSLVESYPHAVYVPTYNVFKDNLDDYLATDQFQPSSLGYQAIAEQLYTIVDTKE